MDALFLLMKIITVLKLGGDFNESHVIWLQKQIREPIYCLTDSKISMDNVTSIPILHNYPGWWSKIELFRGDLGDFLYLDLDTVLLDGIPEEWKQDHKSSILLRNLQGYRHHNSGLMYIKEKDQERIWKSFTKEPEVKMAVYKARGDEGVINEHLNQYSNNVRLWQDLYPDQIISYKYDYLKKKNLDGIKVVLFHAKPRPWEVEESWVPKIIS